LAIENIPVTYSVPSKRIPTILAQTNELRWSDRPRKVTKR
jgi:hypothetical protein